MSTLAFMLAALLDPVQAAIVLAIVLVYRGPQPLVVAAVLAALVSETASVLVADEYAWGDLLAPRAASSFVQAAILCWVVRLIRQGRGSGEVAPTGAGGVGPTPGHNAASLAAGSAVSRPAPWHMRAYVRRRIQKLRIRKHAA